MQDSEDFRFVQMVYFFPKSPLEIFEKGEQAHVPLLVGWNSQEMVYQMIMGQDKPTLDNYKKLLRNFTEINRQKQ
mgnify:CR=1 FL=1